MSQHRDDEDPDDLMVRLRRRMPENTDHRLVSHAFTMHLDRVRAGLGMGETQAEMGRRIIGEGYAAEDAFLVVKAAQVIDARG